MGGDGAQLHLLLLRTNLESATLVTPMHAILAYFRMTVLCPQTDTKLFTCPPNCSWELLECWGSLAAVSWENQGRCHQELSLHSQAGTADAALVAPPRWPWEWRVPHHHFHHQN